MIKNLILLSVLLITSTQYASADCKTAYDQKGEEFKSLKVAFGGLSAGKTNTDLDSLVFDILKEYYSQVFGKKVTHSENKKITKKPIADDDTSKNVQARHMHEYDRILEVLQEGYKGEFCKNGALTRKDVIKAVVPNLSFSIDVR